MVKYSHFYRNVVCKRQIKKESNLIDPYKITKRMLNFFLIPEYTEEDKKLTE